MPPLLQRRCQGARMKSKKTGVVFLLLMSSLSLLIQLNVLDYGSDSILPSLTLASNSSTEKNGLDTSSDSGRTTNFSPSTSRAQRNFMQNQGGIHSILSTYTNTVSLLNSTRGVQLTRLPKTVTPTEMIRLPGIHTYLPHLRNNPDYLTPALMVSRNRTEVKLVIGIPTVQRQHDGYLTQSLKSILTNLNYNDSLNCLIIVFIAEPWNVSYVENLTAKLLKMYPAEIESGLIDIIAPKSEFYPDLDNVPLSFSDKQDRVKWRTKQNLDYAYLMLHTYSRGRYYLQLEDDVITVAGFFNTIITAATRRFRDWFVIRFSPLGFIGKLFHTSDLLFIAEFLLMFYKNKPGDWLLDNIISTKVCGKNTVWKDCALLMSEIYIDVKPSLFQHIGYHSSLKGKVQLLKDKNFILNSKSVMNMTVRKKNFNPIPTSIETTIKMYNGKTIEMAYTGKGFFWGTTPIKGDVIDFKYDPAIQISRYKLVSGNKRNMNDKFPPDTSVEVVFVNNKTAQQNQMVSKSKKFQVVGYFNEKGVAEAEFSNNINIGVFRIHVHSNMTNWVILSLISITPV